MHSAIAQRVFFATPALHYIGDTLAYLKFNFLDQKDRYIGKPLSVLLNDLRIPVTSYLMGGGRYIHYFKDLSLGFNASDGQSRISYGRKEKLYLGFIFADNLSRDSAIALLRQDNMQWLSAEERFYSIAIIGQLFLTDYTRRHTFLPLLRADTVGYQYIDDRYSSIMQGTDDGRGRTSMAGLSYPDSIDAFIASLHNAGARFKLVWVMSKTIVMDGGGPPSGIFLEPETLDLAVVRKRYPRFLLDCALVKALDDEERDYFADLLLYSLAGMSSTDFSKWDTRQRWLGRSVDTGTSYKKLDIRLWRSYLNAVCWGIGQGSNF